MCYIILTKGFFLGKKKGANPQGSQKMLTLHPDGFAGKTQVDARLSGCALV